MILHPKFNHIIASFICYLSLDDFFEFFQLHLVLKWNLYHSLKYSLVKLRYNGDFFGNLWLFQNHPTILTYGDNIIFINQYAVHIS